MINRPIIVALIALNAFLAAGLAAIWLTPQGEWRNIHWAPPLAVLPDYEQMLPALPSRRAISASEFLVSLERPLFSSTRRPPPPPPPPAPEAPPDLLATTKILGIYQADGSSGVIAVVDGKNRRIRLNETLNGWQLRSLSERSVIFVSGGTTRELPLVRAKMTGPVPANTVPATPAQAISPAVQFPPIVPIDSASAAPISPAASEPVAAPRRPRFGP